MQYLRHISLHYGDIKRYLHDLSILYAFFILHQDSEATFMSEETLAFCQIIAQMYQSNERLS